MSARNRKLRMEQMESRQLMAVTPLGALSTNAVMAQFQPSGDIAAYVQDGNLYINETSSFLNTDNGIRISQLSPGHIRVAGTNANNATNIISTVNGHAYQDFIVNHSVFVNMGGGNDLVQIGFDNGSGALLVNQINVNTVTSPQPAMTFAATSSATVGNIGPAADNDRVLVWAAKTRGGVDISTGGGNDVVLFAKDVTVGDGIGEDNVKINTGAGADEVTVKGAFIRGYLGIQTCTEYSENDADVVRLDSAFGQATFVTHSVSISTGAGNDKMYITDPSLTDGQVSSLGVQALGSMALMLGDGDDMAFLRNIRIGDKFTFNAGTGADTLEMRQTPIAGESSSLPAVNGEMWVQMSAGADDVKTKVVTMNNVATNNSLILFLGMGNDSANLTDVSGRTVSVHGQAGNDVVELIRVTAVDNFFAALGDGDDTLKITDLFGGAVATQLDGGNGYDRLSKSGHFPAARLEKNWELINGIPPFKPVDFGPKMKTATMR